MAPSLAASYPVYSAGADSSTLTTSAFTPANGEVLVVKLMTWDTAHGMNAPTDSLTSQTFVAINTAAPGGFNGWAAVYTAIVSGSPGSMTISATTDGTSTRHTMVVERWTGASLAVSPATNATVNGSGSTTATTTLTSTAGNSVVSWCMVDEASRDPAASAYVTTSGTVTEDGLYDGHVGANSVHYSAHQTAATTGSQTFGITNSANLTWVAVGVEILSSAATVNGTASASLTMAAAGTGTRTILGTAAVQPAVTAAATGTRTVLGTAAFAGTLTAAAAGSVARIPDLAGTLTAASTLAGTLTVASTPAGTLTVSGTLAGTLA